jgi:amidase
MTLPEYGALDATDLAALLRRKEVTAEALAALALDGVAAVNGSLNAVIETYPDRLADLSSHRHPDGPLAGVPMLRKDLNAEAGHLLEMGCELTQGLVASEDCHPISRLREAGLNCLGRTTTPELGMASVTESRLAGVTRNPWSPDRTSGGSSGGSSAMVAAGVVPIATAGDGGGSIRSPAAHCGIVGLKPSRGRISNGPGGGGGFGDPAVQFVVTRSARDSAAVMDAIAGFMPGDAFGLPLPARRYVDCLRPPARPLRIAWTTAEISGKPADPACCAAVDLAVRLLEAAGHHLEAAAPAVEAERFWRATLDCVCAGTTLAIDRLAAAMRRTAGPETLQSSTWAFYEYGKRVTLPDIGEALGTFNALNQSVGRFFQRYDIFVTPTCMSPAQPVEAMRCDPPGPVEAAAWSDHMNAIDAFLPVFNSTGNPAISLPLHWSEDGLPVGVQFVAPFGDEATLFELAAFFEEAAPWRHRRPPIHVAHG